MWRPQNSASWLKWQVVTYPVLILAVAPKVKAEESYLFSLPQFVGTEKIKYSSSWDTKTTGCVALGLITAEVIHLFLIISKRMTESRYCCPMQAMTGCADGGVIPLISQLCTRSTWAASLSACFASSAECHNTMKKTLVILQERYVLRKTFLYLKQVIITSFLNPFKFLQPDHPLTYITHCMNTADNNNILLNFQLLFTWFFNSNYKTNEMTLLEMTENFTFKFLNIHIKLLV